METVNLLNSNMMEHRLLMNMFSWREGLLKLELVLLLFLMGAGIVMALTSTWLEIMGQNLTSAYQLLFETLTNVACLMTHLL